MNETLLLDIYDLLEKINYDIPEYKFSENDLLEINEDLPFSLVHHKLVREITHEVCTNCKQIDGICQCLEYFPFIKKEFEFDFNELKLIFIKYFRNKVASLESSDATVDLFSFVYNNYDYKILIVDQLNDSHLPFLQNKSCLVVTMSNPIYRGNHALDWYSVIIGDKSDFLTQLEIIRQNLSLIDNIATSLYLTDDYFKIIKEEIKSYLINHKYTLLSNSVDYMPLMTRYSILVENIIDFYTRGSNSILVHKSITSRILISSFDNFEQNTSSSSLCKIINTNINYNLSQNIKLQDKIKRGNALINRTSSISAVLAFVFSIITFLYSQLGEWKYYTIARNSIATLTILALAAYTIILLIPSIRIAMFKWSIKDD